jgi:hypothetical protein
VTEEPVTVSCAAGCKRVNRLKPDGALETGGWEFLPIAGNRYRCPSCTAELIAARDLAGAEGGFEPDPLPPDSTGALKRREPTPHSEPTVKP